MGYPILDSKGIFDVGGRSSYYIEIPDNSINKLKKIQQLFLSNFALTVINSLKTAQKFISTRTFFVLPDITELNLIVNDNNLFLFYNLNKKDKYSIEHQIKYGEGNLSNKQIADIVNFSLRSYKHKQSTFTQKKYKTTTNKTSKNN